MSRLLHALGDGQGLCGGSFLSKQVKLMAYTIDERNYCLLITPIRNSLWILCKQNLNTV
jgi:hypothetical protein